jgi:acyl dehydratase
MSSTPADFDVTRLNDLLGRESVSAWVDLRQDTIDLFGDVTGDRQWIHVDPARARHDSPHGTTIAHGFLTLALMSRLLREAVPLGCRPGVAINYGLNKVRFPSPLPAGSRVRGRFTLAHLEPVSGNAWQATWSAVIEREGSEKPCCVAEWLVRYYP